MMTVDCENSKILESVGPKKIMVDSVRLKNFIQSGLTKQKLMKHQENRKLFLKSHMNLKKDSSTSQDPPKAQKGPSRFQETPQRTRNFETELI